MPFHLLALSAVAAVAADAPDQVTNATTHSLVPVDPLATCLNGAPAWVSVGGPPSKPGGTWVLQLGPAYGGAGAPCLDRTGCQMAAKKPIAPPPLFEMLASSGPQSPNCTINPDFCTATQAQLVMCDGAMLLGMKDADLNGTKAYFRGVKVLAAAVKLLSTMGLSKASHLLLSGVDHGGTSAILNADTVAAMLPKTVSVKVLGVDALHPQFEYMWDIPPQKPNSWKSWYPTTLMYLESVAGLTVDAKHLWLNESLGGVKTPLMLVQATPGVNDLQCLLDGWGVVNGGVQCSPHKSAFRAQYTCTQYPDLCAPFVVENYTVPLQLAYKAQNTMKATPTNGAFFHSCYLGSYWGMTFSCGEAGTASCTQVPRQKDGVWNQIAIKGKTMRKAVGDWWAGKPALFYDPPWDPQGKPPVVTAVKHSSESQQHGDDWHVSAPKVPWYTSHFYSNPTCRGYPWY